MICDLCGGNAFETVVELNRPTALRSDRVIVNRRLVKVACTRCGLVCSGEDTPESAVGAEYASDYCTATTEHVFYTGLGTVARSGVLADWLTERIPHEIWRTDA